MAPSGLAYEEGCSLPSALGGRGNAENEAPKALTIDKYFSQMAPGNDLGIRGALAPSRERRRRENRGAFVPLGRFSLASALEIGEMPKTKRQKRKNRCESEGEGAE